MIDGENRSFDCAQRRGKARALRRALLVAARGGRPKPKCAPSCAISRPAIRSTSRRSARICAWTGSELAQLAADPLVTIGAHTVNHPMLAKLPADAVRAEMDLSRSVIEAALSRRPQHLSYPFGDRDLGRAARIRHRRRARFQDRGDDAAGRPLRRAPRAPDRAAAHLAQRRVSSSCATCACCCPARRRRCGTASARSGVSSVIANAGVRLSSDC